MSDTDDITTEPVDDVDTDRVDDDTPEGAEQLGDRGKKALDAMKGKWQKERDARKALADQVAKLTAGKGNDDTGQPDPEEIRKQARAEATAEVLRDRALDKVETKAARLFADPEDARALLAGRVDEFVDNGQVDTDAIEEALADLLSKKPHLAAATAKRFQGSADGGARNGKSKPSQLSRDDVTRLARQGKHAEIEKARVDGRLDDLLSGQ